jgi:hypothetical protein
LEQSILYITVVRIVALDPATFARDRYNNTVFKLSNAKYRDTFQKWEHYRLNNKIQEVMFLRSHMRGVEVEL